MPTTHIDHCRRPDCEPKTVGKQQIIRYAGSYAQAKDGRWFFWRFTGWNKVHPESVALKAALANAGIGETSHACTYCRMSQGALEAAQSAYNKTLVRGLVSETQAAIIRAEVAAITACLSVRVKAP